MSTCRKLENALKSGKFVEHISELPKDLREHLSECLVCKQVFDELVETENLLQDTCHIVLSRRARARIRLNVADAISTPVLRQASWLKPALGIASTLIIVFFLMMHPADHQPDSDITAAALKLDSALVNDMLELIDTDLSLYDDSDLETAIITQSDTELLSAALETLDAPAQYMYDDTFLATLSDLEENEWNLLRRYMI